MNTLATLGLKIDSSQVTTANTALDKFQASANTAATAADKLQAATKRNAPAFKTMQDAVKDFDAALQKAVGDVNVGLVAMRNGTDRAGKGLEILAKSTGLTRAEMINLSRQVQDVGVSLASGQSPFMVLAQQGTQIADIFGSSKTGTVGGALRQMASGIASVLTPARLLAGGVAGIAVAGVAMAKWAADGAKQFDDVSRSIGATRTQLHALQQAASNRGIGQDDFFKGIGEFGAQVYQAKNNMGALGTLFRANGVSATGFADSMEKAADLIKNAKDDQQRLVLLQQMGLPATMEWVKFLSQGADGIRAATKAAVEFDQTAEGKLIASARKFDEAWNAAITKFVNTFKAAMVQIAGSAAGVQIPQWMVNAGRGAYTGAQYGGIPGAVVGGIYGASKGDAGTFDDRFGGFAPSGNFSGLQQGLDERAKSSRGEKSTVDPNVEATNLARMQARIGLLGNLATVEDQVRAKELELAAAALQGVGVTKQQAEAIKTVVRAQAEMSRVFEQASVGVFDLAKAQQAANDNLQALVARGLLDPNNAEQFAAAQNYAAKQVKALSNEAKIASSALPQFQAALNEASDAQRQLDSLATEAFSVNRSFFVEFGQQLRSGASAWESFKDAGLNALSKIADKLMQMAADNLFASAFGGSSGGTGGGILGTLGSLLGGGGGSAASGSVAVGSYIMPTIGYANGGFTGHGGKYQPAGIVHKGEYVMDAVTVRRVGVANLDSLRGYADGGLVGSMARAAGGSGSPAVVMQDNRQFSIGQGANTFVCSAKKNPDTATQSTKIGAPVPMTSAPLCRVTVFTSHFAVYRSLGARG